MAGLGEISPNGTWLGIQWFNKTSNDDSAAAGSAAEGFSITSLTLTTDL